MSLLTEVIIGEKDLDRRIEEVRRETEAIRKANEALKRLYDNNDDDMKRLASS